MFVCTILPFPLQDLTEESCNNSLRQLTFLLVDGMCSERVEFPPFQKSSSCAELQTAAKLDLSRDELLDVRAGLNCLPSRKSTESVSMPCEEKQMEMDSNEEWQVRQSVVVSKEALHNTEKRSDILACFYLFSFYPVTFMML